MKLIKDKYHYEIQLNTNSDRRVLLTLKDDKHINYIGKGINHLSQMRERMQM